MKLDEKKKGKILPTGDVTEISEEQASLDALANYENLFQEDYVGFATGRMGSVGETFWDVPGFTITDKQAEFYAQEATLKNKVIKQITGANMSVQEAGRIMDQIPSRNNPGKSWRAKMKQTKKNIGFLEKRRLANLKGAGYDTSGLEGLGGESSLLEKTQKGVAEALNLSDEETLAEAERIINQGQQ